jgi:hypothetical protein
MMPRSRFDDARQNSDTSDTYVCEYEYDAEWRVSGGRSLYTKGG